MNDGATTAADLLADAARWQAAGFPAMAQAQRDKARLVAAAALRDLLDGEQRAAAAVPNRTVDETLAVLRGTMGRV